MTEVPIMNLPYLPNHTPWIDSSTAGHSLTTTSLEYSLFMYIIYLGFSFLRMLEIKHHIYKEHRQHDLCTAFIWNGPTVFSEFTLLHKE